MVAFVYGTSNTTKIRSTERTIFVNLYHPNEINEYTCNINIFIEAPLHSRCKERKSLRLISLNYNDIIVIVYHIHQSVYDITP